MKIQRITKRWLGRSFLVIVAALIVIEALVIVLTRNSYLSSAQSQVKTAASVIQTTLNAYAADADVDFLERTRKLVETFPEKNFMELVAVGQDGKPIMSSSGFQPQDMGKTDDVYDALRSESNMGQLAQTLSSGENVFCVSVASPNQVGDIVALRLMASMQPANRLILNYSIVYIVVGIAIVTFILLINLVFLHSILSPISEVEKTARKIAGGDFEARIDNKYKDEMGDLCDIINYMADELSQSENMKNEFISSVSHELRTPLTAIRGWGETLADDVNCDKNMRKKGLKVIINETERLSSIVEDLLDFSKIQSGRFSIKQEKMDILAELEEALVTFSERTQRENITLEYNEPVLLSPVLGDRNRIRQVFVNVLDNAIKYSEPDTTVKITAVEEYGFVSISVEDQGCGIAAEDLPKIKKKFYKANHSRRGSGIGLAVVDEIVSMLGGSLDIKSELGVGTCVVVSFPIARDKEEKDE